MAAAKETAAVTTNGASCKAAAPSVVLKKGPEATFVVRATNPYLMASYGVIVTTWALSQVILIPYVLHLLVLVTAILYAACHGSLVLLDHGENDIDEVMLPDGSTHSSSSSDKNSNRETLRKEDAMQFPIIGSISLFSLYLCFKFLDKDLVNLIIGGYFGIVGCLAMTMTFAPALAALVFSKNNNKQYQWEYKWNHSLPEFILGPSPLDLSQEMNLSEILSLGISAIICAFYVYYKP
jgi:hypothetical protein